VGRFPWIAESQNRVKGWRLPETGPTLLLWRGKFKQAGIETEVARFGGVKQSGIGREGSKHGLDDYLEVEYICVDQQRIRGRLRLFQDATVEL
jgi:succinate-semialdehyde dehydrogenase / glutarate-semialdehyde dehydrogenase